MSNLLVNVEICGSEVITMNPQKANLTKWYYKNTASGGIANTHVFGPSTYKLFSSTSNFCAIDKYVLQTFNGN